LLPEHNIVDAGYIDAEALVAAQTTYQGDLVGPTAKEYRWQAREQNGYAFSNFSIDWEQEQAQCPQGQVSSSWTPTWTRNQESIKITFGFTICGACPVRAQYTKTKRRSLSVRRQEAQFA
jgi:transposase